MAPPLSSLPMAGGGVFSHPGKNTVKTIPKHPWAPGVTAWPLLAAARGLGASAPVLAQQGGGVGAVERLDHADHRTTQYLKVRAISGLHGSDRLPFNSARGRP